MTKWWRSHSVRVRLTLWYVGAMLVVLGVYAAAIFAFVSRAASDALDQQLRRDFELAAATVYQTTEGMFAWTPEEELIPDRDLLWLQVWSADGSERLFWNPEVNRRPLPDGQMLAMRADEGIIRIPAEPDPVRVLSRRIQIGLLNRTDRPIPVIIQVSRSEAEMREDLRDLAFILLVGLPLAVALAGFGGYELARRALEPIERMTDRARHITAERLGERLPVDNPDDEMGRLASVFNETLGRLESSFAQMRQFTADVSHELRTPLTAIRSVGEVGLRGHRDEAAYRAMVGSMLEEADRLATLVDRLLTLSRAETGQASLKAAEVDLTQLAEEVIAHLGVLAEEKRQSIEVEHAGQPLALADRVTLRQALINLVDNAIKYSPVGGTIVVRAMDEGRDVVIEVIDSGPGIPTEARTRVFDRFYRGADGVTGTGLGLSIAKGAIEANGGKLTLESTGENGTRFRIRVPGVRPERRRAAV